MGNGKRWVVVAPPGSVGTGLLLAQASDDRQRSRIGDQTGGRVGWFLHTDDFDRDHARMSAAGVHVRRGRRGSSPTEPSPCSRIRTGTAGTSSAGDAPPIDP